MTYTFNLVENANWHDGVPLTADDIVFSFRAMKDPDSVPVLVGRNTSSSVQAWVDLTESWPSDRPLYSRARDPIPGA